MLSANRIEEVIKNCQALIQQKSYSGQEGEVVNAIKTMMQHYQFDDIHVDKYGNIVGGIVGNQPGKNVGSRWTYRYRAGERREVVPQPIRRRY
ncbi:Acetylornithine deacetylase [Citrobacter freundii]|uniref:Acetylornithine deacetylase n=1 Tax=Citrobacter freundii TaxID=546 RepID=A0A7G2IPX2_CITFR|nr:Acetylornithine deacetylase [Citrobacter freundii]